MAQLFETTDAPAGRTTTYLMGVGDEFFGSLDRNTSDWVAVTLTAGQKYTFGAVGVGVLGEQVRDPWLVLHGPGGAQLKYNDDGGPGLSSLLTYTATVSGTFYIEVGSYAGKAGSDYGLAMSLGNRVHFGVEMGAAELTRTEDSWAPTARTAVSVTWGFRETGPATDASGYAAPFHKLTVAQQAATIYALDNFSDVANISFVRQDDGTGFTNDATILIGAYTSTTDGAGAYAHFPGSTASGDAAGDMWINTDSVRANTLPIGSYDRWVFLHELGHAMGLSHPGDYNAAPGVTITYQNSAQFAEDSAQYTLMSYFDATDTAPNAPRHYADTLMMYDIYAMQQLYGVNLTTRAGDSTYGFHSNTGAPYDYSKNKAPLQCIWDGAGNDTLDLSGFTQNQRIDLRDGHFSDVGGFENNVSIAKNCMIENAVGGSGADGITGNDLVNRLFGRAGDDTIEGGAGKDRLIGGLGADHFVFSAGSGIDTITDFNPVDELVLSASLWGGAALSAAEVVADFAVMRMGHVVLDFGADRIILSNLADTAGLDTHILLA